MFFALSFVIGMVAFVLSSFQSTTTSLSTIYIVQTMYIQVYFYFLPFLLHCLFFFYYHYFLL